MSTSAVCEANSCDPPLSLSSRSLHFKHFRDIQMDMKSDGAPRIEFNQKLKTLRPNDLIVFGRNSIQEFRVDVRMKHECARHESLLRRLGPV